MVTLSASRGYGDARVEASAQPLRPLTFGQVLDVAFKIVFRNVGQLLLTVAVVVIPVQVIEALVLLSAFPAAFDASQQQAFTGEVQQQPQFDTDQLLVGAAGTIVAGLFAAAATLLATAACFKAIGDAYLGERPHWRASLGFAFSRAGRILWVGLLLVLSYVLPFLVLGILGALAPLLLILLIPLLIGGIYVWTRWTVALPALLLEDARGVRAFGRSWRLVGTDRWWFTCGINVMAILIAFLAGIVLGALVIIPALLEPGNILLNASAQTIVGAVSLILTTPITAAFTIVLYFDHRVRKEGLDLELLAQRIGATPPAGGYGRVQAPPPPAAPPPGSWSPPQAPPSAPERPDRGPSGG
jgi:hypothetical protein